MERPIKLLIHHHAFAYIDKNNHIWVQSFIGAWVNELAKYFPIGLLLHETSIKLEKQDFRITSQNVSLESLGPNHGLRNRISRLKWINKKCKELDSYTHLIVRGVTARQLLVIKASRVKNKFFLLVGSIEENQVKQIRAHRDLFHWFMRKRQFMQLKIISQYATMLGNSPVIQDELNRNFGVSSKYVLTNTISLEHFREKTSLNAPEKLLFVGRVEKEKGIEELVLAFKSLWQSGKYHLNIVGPVDMKYKKVLLSMAGSAAKSISFKGFVRFGEDLFKFYDDSDVFILPSYHEGFPHSIWEAGARSIPVVCTPVGGIPGLIDETMCTFVQSKSSFSIELAIKELTINPLLMEKKKKILFNYTKKMTVETSAKMLSGILTESTK